MIITKKIISRREILRGMGATLALPLLDAMVPALSAQGKTAAKPINRFGVMYVPNGMIMNKWTPVLDGSAFELTPTLSSLAPHRDQLLILSIWLVCPLRAGRAALMLRQAPASSPTYRLQQARHGSMWASR